VLNALRQSEENHLACHISDLRHWQCSTPYGNQRKTTLHRQTGQ